MPEGVEYQIVYDPTQSGHAVVQIEHEEQSINNQMKQIENGGLAIVREIRRWRWWMRWWEPGMRRMSTRTGTSSIGASTPKPRPGGPPASAT